MFLHKTLYQHHFLKGVILLIFLINGFFNFSLKAQTSHLSIGLGSSATSRILTLDKHTFSDDEIKIAKKLEVPKPSYDISIGYVRMKNNSIKYEAGLSYRWLRFGTSIYRLTDSIFNVTPQYPKVRELVQQNQISGYYKYFFRSFFIQADAIFNYRNYFIRAVSFDENDDAGFRGKGWGEDFKSPPFDAKISLGGILPVWKRKNEDFVLLNYYMGSYIRPYDIFGKGIGGYLIFDKNTSGFVWDIGIKLQYIFSRSK